MKKALILLLISTFLLTACEKETLDEKTGEIEVAVTYFDSNSQKHNPDVGAAIYLFKINKPNVYSDNISTSATITAHTKNGIYDFKAIVGAVGITRITDIPYGDYLMMTTSKARFSAVIDTITVNVPTIKIDKKFGAGNDAVDKD